MADEVRLTTLTEPPPTADTGEDDATRRTARAAGLWYLALAVSGMVSFLLIRPQIHVPGDAAATFSNLIERSTLAHLGLAAEMAVVATQAVAAVWFYKLFRRLNPSAAWAVGVFGTVNAVAIMASAVFLATALGVAGNPALASAGTGPATAQLLYELSSNAWGIGGLFFGLWLIPMGYVAATSGRMPRALGWILMVGGLGYVASAILRYAIPGVSTSLVEALPIVATVGELWMIGFLLVRGLRPTPAPA